MGQRKHTVALSFILLKYAFAIVISMFVCILVWSGGVNFFRNAGIVSNRNDAAKQVQEWLGGKPQEFIKPGNDFLADYAVFDKDNMVIDTNVSGKKLEYIQSIGKSTMEAGEESTLENIDTDIYFFADETYIIFHWDYDSHFVNGNIRRILPEFEFLWIAIILILWIICLILLTVHLKKYLTGKLSLFSYVSEKVASQELNFTVPKANIKEYDEALGAMEKMRSSLSDSLSQQWEARREREHEMAALSHDMKTPITLIGGNAELLMEENLPADVRKKVETIAQNNEKTRQYVINLIDMANGEEEAFVLYDLDTLIVELAEQNKMAAQSANVELSVSCNVTGNQRMQKDHLLRALGNLVLNAVEHTPQGGKVTIHAEQNREINKAGWTFRVQDGGSGFSKGALLHATERLWREDESRTGSGHNGLGLWFADKTIKAHGGSLELQNNEQGGRVICYFE